MVRMRTGTSFLLIAALTACGRHDDRSTTPRGGDSTNARSASTANGGLVYVSNEDSRNLSVIDVATDSVVSTIEVGTRPRGVKVSPDGRTVYVALSGSPKCPPTMPDAECAKKIADRKLDGIAVVDVATRKTVKVLPAGLDPETFDLSADGSTLFVSNEDADSLTIVDIASGRAKSNVKVGREPEGVTVAPDGKTVWVTSEGDNSVAVVDVATGKSLAQIGTDGKRPRAIGFLPDGSKAYVTNETSGNVAVIDPDSHILLRTIVLPAGSRPMGVAVSRDGHRVFISNGRGGTVSVIDAARDSVLSTAPVGTRPWGIALSPDSRWLYTANGPGNDVSVVDVQTMKVVHRILVGGSPWGVAIGAKP